MAPALDGSWQWCGSSVGAVCWGTHILPLCVVPASYSGSRPSKRGQSEAARYPRSSFWNRYSVACAGNYISEGQWESRDAECIIGVQTVYNRRKQKFGGGD